MSDELKPVRCGCGGKADVYVMIEEPNLYLIKCEKCKTSSGDYATKAEAIEAWNTAMRGNKIGESSVRMAEWLAQPLTK